MGKLAESILKDIQEVLNRPVFSPTEQEVLVGLINTKITKAIEAEVHPYRMETENLTNFVTFQLEEGASYHDILF